jgi:4-amino-4-deoxy-L-arabinose transferase-like glycosyltransferase
MSAATAGRIALAAVAIAAFLLRVPSIAEPLGIDQGLFASGAKALSRGYVFYRDVWDQKPPTPFLVYRLAFDTFGWRAAAIAWLDLLASALTAVLLLVTVRRLASLTAGLIAAALYAALTMPAWLYRHSGILERSVPEVFIGVVVTAAACFAAIALGMTGVRRLSAAAASGLMLGAAAALKPNAAIYAPALLLWITVCSSGESRPLRARMIVAVLVGAAIVPALVLAWIWSSGAWGDARIALIDFNRFYVASDLSISRFATELAKAFWLRMKTDPLWAAGSLGGVLAAWHLIRTRRPDPLPLLAVLLGAAAAGSIAVNGARLFNTYFIQALPPLAIAAAWLLGVGRSRSVIHRLAFIAAVVVIGVLLARRSYMSKVADSAWMDFQQLRGRTDRAAYLEYFGGYGIGRGFSARANDEVAAYIGARTGRDDLIYQFGINSAGIYFAADRLMAQRFLRVNEFVPAVFPAPGFNLRSVVTELAARRPVYLIFEQLHTGTEMANAVDALQSAPEIQPLLRSYRREAQIEDYTLYRREP